MIPSQVTNWAYQPAEIEDGQGGATTLTFPLPARPRSARLNSPNGLVASSDEDVQQELAEIMRQCNLTTLLAFTVGESRRIVDCQEVSLVLCDDRLIDGNYEDILTVAERSRARAPVIVVSPTGDWPDYLKAIGAGAFDYMIYPLILGELPRVIRNALASRTASGGEEAAIKIWNASKGEMP
jgi:DNA-binding NtrC family response regulator